MHGTGRRYRCEISFFIEDVDRLNAFDKMDLTKFITDALESWGGERHPDDWLFDSLEDVKVRGLKAYRRTPEEIARDQKAGQQSRSKEHPRSEA